MDIGADGLKTGNIDESGFGLVGSAVQNGQRLIVVVNGLKTVRDRASEARKLLEWGFRAFEPRTDLRRPARSSARRASSGAKRAGSPLKAKGCSQPAPAARQQRPTDRPHRLSRPADGAGPGGHRGGAAAGHARRRSRRSTCRSMRPRLCQPGPAAEPGARRVAGSCDGLGPQGAQAEAERSVRKTPVHHARRRRGRRQVDACAQAGATRRGLGPDCRADA